MRAGGAVGARAGRRRPRSVLGTLPVLVAACLLAAPPASAQELQRPRSAAEPPAGFRLSARDAVRIAERTGAVRSERAGRPELYGVAYTRGRGRWQVSWFAAGDERAQVHVDDRTGRVLEAFTGPQVAWEMARGYEGAFGRRVNAPYVWLPRCLLFLAPFLDPRRPFRLLHLDLLVLLAFGVSHVFFNRGEISLSVPLVYPVLGYLLVRMLLAGFRGGERREPLVPLVPAAWLALGVVFLVGFRVGLNVADSNVIDVGYSGVIGADRIADGDALYGAGFSRDNEHGDTYGPVNYLAYLPFEQALPWDGGWGALRAAHGAAIAFDLLTMLALFLLGRRLRPREEGRLLGLALAFAWASYPYTLFALETNSNDSLVALLLTLALLALSSAPGRGLFAGLAAAAKLGPVVLAPLLLTGTSGRRLRPALISLAVFTAVAMAAFAPFVPDGGVRELYDRTLGYQAGRDSPFGIWGQEPSLEWLRVAVQALAIGLVALVAVVPRRRTRVQVAALGAAVLIAAQLAAPHWFYLYVVWFTPFVLVALFACHRLPGERAAPPAAARQVSRPRAAPARSRWTARPRRPRPAPRSARRPPRRSRTSPAAW